MEEVGEMTAFGTKMEGLETQCFMGYATDRKGVSDMSGLQEPMNKSLEKIVSRQRFEGRIVRVPSGQKFGFIMCDGIHKEVYAHSCNMKQRSYFRAGVEVDFVLLPPSKADGLMEAIDIRVVGQ